MKQNEFIIDVDKVIDIHNKKNPEKRKLDRKTLAEVLEVNQQVFSDWKRVRSPKVVDRIMKLIEIGDCKIEDFVIKKE